MTEKSKVVRFDTRAKIDNLGKRPGERRWTLKIRVCQKQKFLGKKVSSIYT